MSDQGAASLTSLDAIIERMERRKAYMTSRLNATKDKRYLSRIGDTDRFLALALGRKDGLR